MPDTTDAMLSRPANSSPRGKLTERIEFMIDDESKAAVVAHAFVAGIPPGEYVRRLVWRDLWGSVSMLRSVAHEGDDIHAENSR